MILNSYETIYILKPNVSEEINISIVNKCKVLIKSQGAKNIFIQHRGRRHLSFDIDKNYDGIYIQINYDGNGHMIKTLEKFMKFDEYIIRYLTVKKYKRQINNL